MTFRYKARTGYRVNCSMNPIPITRRRVRLSHNPDRVITKPFHPGEEAFPDGQSRARAIIKRILAMPESDVASTLAATEQQFADRHADLGSIVENNFAGVAGHIDNPDELSEERRRLIGAYFTHEYSIEAAALTNPSIVPAPDQSGLQPGDLRFIMSLRAIGEGHISSIEFRLGVIDAHGEITMASRISITATKTETQVYSFFRNALAPFWISVIRKTMRSSPGGAASTAL